MMISAPSTHYSTGLELRLESSVGGVEMSGETTKRKDRQMTRNGKLGQSVD